MKWIRFTILVLLLVTGAMLAFGSPGVAEKDQASEPPVSASGGTPQQEEAEEGDGRPLETFIPTERLPADSAISFPVDI